MEPTLARAISSAQRGFLLGRSMLHNVAAAVFSDFAAAFQSMAHDFMLDVLAHLSLPRSFREFVANLCVENGCRISAGGSTHPGFAIRAGARQGCPLSPLLFAFCGDLLLRRLTTVLLEDLVCAHADDMSLVTQDFLTSVDTFVPLFRCFASISGLRLSLSKTVIVPLGDSEIRGFRAQLAARFPDRGAAAPIQRWADYVLGLRAGARGGGAHVGQGACRARLRLPVARPQGQRRRLPHALRGGVASRRGAG